MSNLPVAFRLDRVGVIDFSGDDRLAIVHNLTTNAVKSLDVDRGCETFVTDVRGKALAHVMLYAMWDRIRMLGPHGFSSKIAEHADRYTIREDAVPTVADDNFVAFVLSTEGTEMVLGHRSGDGVLQRSDVNLGEANVEVYPCHWLGDGTSILLGSAADSRALVDSLAALGIVIATQDEFHSARIAFGFPWYGVDLDDSNLPQEADRDSATISFTKGCYLGQETIARLDALGQVQKKLVRWRIESESPAVRVGTTLDYDGKTVGRLTSVAKGQNGTTFAIGFARRSHFDPGSEAKFTDEESGEVHTAVVVC